MSLTDLAEELRRACAAAPKGDHVTTIHLFGIAHAARLEGVNLKDLATRAGIKESFHTELRKGMRLSKFVKVVAHPS